MNVNLQHYFVDEDPDVSRTEYAFKKNGSTEVLRHVSPLGKGSFAAVHLCETLTKEPLVLRKITGQTEEICTYLVEAVEQVRYLNGHPNIAEIHQIYFFEKKGDRTVYMTMVTS